MYRILPVARCLCHIDPEVGDLGHIWRIHTQIMSGILLAATSRSFIETAWFLSCTDKKAYLGVIKAWLGSSWRIGQLDKQQNRCFMV